MGSEMETVEDGWYTGALVDCVIQFNAIPIAWVSVVEIQKRRAIIRLLPGQPIGSWPSSINHGTVLRDKSAAWYLIVYFAGLILCCCLGLYSEFINNQQRSSAVVIGLDCQKVRYSTRCACAAFHCCRYALSLQKLCITGRAAILYRHR